MSAIANWVDDRTGAVSAVRKRRNQPIPGGARFRYVLPATIVFGFVVQAITGLFLWMYYSASAQTAWASVFHLQYEVQGGWLLRAIHHYTAQVTVVLAGLYLLQLILGGGYRKPREFVFWVAVLIFLMLMAQLLTADLLPWQQSGVAATGVRLNYLNLIPVIGGDLQKLALGGDDFGHLTLTHFFALHAGLFAGILLLLIVWHGRLIARVGLTNKRFEGRPAGYRWPSQAWRNALACLVVLGVIALLVAHRPLVGDPMDRLFALAEAQQADENKQEENGAAQPAGNQAEGEDQDADAEDNAAEEKGEAKDKPAEDNGEAEDGGGDEEKDQAEDKGEDAEKDQPEHAAADDQESLAERFGVPMGVPAGPGAGSETARPEWAYRPLYALALAFPPELEYIPVFCIPGALVGFALLMPFIGMIRIGHWFNVLASLGILGGLTYLGIESYRKDIFDPNYRQAVAKEKKLAHRAVVIAQAPDGIPVDGAHELLLRDPKTRGPELGTNECAKCHNYGAPGGENIKADEPAAADLYQFASRAWLEGLLDPKQVNSPKYFGNTRFANGVMAYYVEHGFAELEKKEQEAIIAALSAETGLSQEEPDDDETERITKGRELIASRECARCHHFGNAGPLGDAPVLTGYGTRDWIVGILKNPNHPWLYGMRNDEMPAYAESLAKPEDHKLTLRDIDVMASWLRGQWYEPGRQAEEEQPAKPETPIEVLAYQWESREAPQYEFSPGEPWEQEARNLYVQMGCSVCHYHTGTKGGDIKIGDSSAFDLGGFASREWVAGFLDPKQNRGPKYFGNTAFKNGEMVDYLKEAFDVDKDELELVEEDYHAIGLALSAEAKLPSQAEAEEEDAEDIKLGRELIADTCTECHKFGDEGALGSAPELTGYGSVEWLTGILANPAHNRFYPEINDGMPAYESFSNDPPEVRRRRIEILAHWLRGEPAPAANPAAP